MPASRDCRQCGAPLPADIRWCGRCYAPVRELTPRAPLHDADFVAMPHHTSGNVAHWSRWEQSATTFGPVGRIACTLLVFASLPAALSAGLFLYLVTFPLVAGMLLRAIWSKGWVIPGEVEGPPLPEQERPLPAPVPSRTRAMLAWRIAWVSGLVLAGVIFTYGPVEAKAAAIALGALIGLAWFFRGFLSR